MNTKATIKINSYTNKNYVLFDDEIIFGNTNIQTYSNESIIDCADDLLKAIYADSSTLGGWKYPMKIMKVLNFHDAYNDGEEPKLVEVKTIVF